MYASFVVAITTVTAVVTVRSGVLRGHARGLGGRRPARRAGMTAGSSVAHRGPKVHNPLLGS